MSANITIADNDGRNRTLTTLSYAAGGVTAAIGGLVLCGWAFDVAVLKSPVPGTAAMKANTAAAFILAGLALILLQRSGPIARALVRICGLTIALTGLLTLCQYLCGSDLGIDQLLFREPGTADAALPPGRMAPNTALNFTLLGSAFIGLTGQRCRAGLFVIFATIFSLSISIVGLTGYLTGLAELAGPAAYVRMAVHTATAFIVFSLGLLITAYERQHAPVSVEQKLFAGLTVVAAVIIVVSVLSVSHVDSLVRANRQVEQTLKVKQEVGAVLSSVVDLETGARGYILTGDERYAEPLLKARHDLPAQLAKLRALTSDNPRQQQALDSLDALAAARIAVSEQLREIRGSQGLNAAVALLQSGEGKRITDAIRVLVARMQAEEDELLQRRNTLAARQSERNKLVVYLSLGLQMILLAFIYGAMKRDITRRNALVEELRLKDIVFETSLTANSTADNQGVINHVNEAFLEMWGYASKEEAIGNSVASFFANEQEARPVLAALNTVGRWEGEFLAKRKNGTSYVSHGFATVIRDAAGKPIGYQSMNLDVTQQRRAEETLRRFSEELEEQVRERSVDLSRSEERYRRLVESTTNYIYSVTVENNQATATTHSPGCVSTTGYTEEDFRADPYLWYRMIHEQDRQRVTERIDTLLAGGEPLTMEHRIVHKSGTTRWVSDTLVPKYDGGRLVAYDGLVVDITARKMLQEMEIARLAAESANRAKSDFLANMSHELRTPLNAIIGFSDILDQGLQGELTPDQAQSVKDIGDSGRHLLSLINDILDLSKIEAGKMVLEPEELDVGVLTRESLTFFREKALKHRLALSAEIAEGTGEIVADARKVKQVIVNLLSNAVKFTPDGGRIRVRVRRLKGPPHPALSPQAGRGVDSEFLAPAGGGEDEGEGASPDGEFVEVAVEDTGIGISLEDQKRLFQPFQQLQTVLTKEYAGTGLGLSLCKSFVELHGGGIRVESVPGRGSTFTFTLPVKPIVKREPPSGQTAGKCA